MYAVYMICRKKRPIAPLSNDNTDISPSLQLISPLFGNSPESELVGIPGLLYDLRPPEDAKREDGMLSYKSEPDGGSCGCKAVLDLRLNGT